MASTRRSTTGWTRARAVRAGLAAAFAVGLVGCGGDDAEGGGGGGGDGASAATASSDGSAPPAAKPTAEELADMLLTVEQVDARWTSEGPEPLQMEGVVSRCPEGSAFATPVDAMFVRFTPPEPFSNVIDQGLLTFADAGDIDAWFDALESCAGKSWTEGSDPTEHVDAEAIDMDDHGDARAAFILRFAHEADVEPLHVTRWYLVRLGDALLVMSGDDTDLGREADEEFLEDVLDRAVTKAESALAD